MRVRVIAVSGHPHSTSGAHGYLYATEGLADATEEWVPSGASGPLGTTTIPEQRYVPLDLGMATREMISVTTGSWISLSRTLSMVNTFRMP